MFGDIIRIDGNFVDVVNIDKATIIVKNIIPVL